MIWWNQDHQDLDLAQGRGRAQCPDRYPLQGHALGLRPNLDRTQTQIIPPGLIRPRPNNVFVRAMQKFFFFEGVGLIGENSKLIEQLKNLKLKDFLLIST